MIPRTISILDRLYALQHFPSCDAMLSENVSTLVRDVTGSTRIPATSASPRVLVPDIN